MDDVASLKAEIARLKADLDDANTSVIAFAAPCAVRHGKDRGWKPGEIHATHYDILKKAGARMDSFIRREP